MTILSHNDEAEVERRLIEVLGEGYNQWNFRPDLKSENDLWNNLRAKITQTNLSEGGDHPNTDKESDTSKTESSLKTKTPSDAAKWLNGENGTGRLMLQGETTAF